MAVAIAFKPSTDKGPHVPGDRRRASVTITFDTSYPTGGEAVAPGDVGLTFIHSANVCGPSSAGKPVFWTGSKLKVFSSIGTELSDTSDIHTETVDVEFIGI